MASCDATLGTVNLLVWLLVAAGLFCLSRLLSPVLTPRTYAQLRNEPGGCGYWDSSVASSLNAVLLVVFAAIALAREPQLLLSSDLYHSTVDSCRVSGRQPVHVHITPERARCLFQFHITHAQVNQFFGAWNIFEISSSRPVK